MKSLDTAHTEGKTVPVNSHLWDFQSEISLLEMKVSKMLASLARDLRSFHHLKYLYHSCLTNATLKIASLLLDVKSTVMVAWF
jgi:hypothetical protein